MKKLLSKIWEAPQKVLAHLIIKLSKAQLIGEYQGAKLYHWKWQGGMSLSTHIFLPFETLTNSLYQQDYIKHEYGHTVQSAYLGIVYLLIIGAPSFLWAWLGKSYREKNNISYYSFYTESWADKLGGVNRED